MTAYIYANGAVERTNSTLNAACLIGDNVPGSQDFAPDPRNASLKVRKDVLRREFEETST